MKTTTIAFIGGGNMARSLIGGLIADGFAASAIWAADPRTEARTDLQDQFGINVTGDNTIAATQAEVILLAVKPQLMREVATHLAATVQQRRPLIISIAAGVREADLQTWLGGNLALVRCMPNTPALLQSGATGLYANALVSPEQKTIATTILTAAGVTVWLTDETLLDAVTAVSGSGPAYFFLVMEAMEQAGIELGLSAEQARLLTLQTALGAARMALDAGESPGILRQRVTSPGGTTERAIGILRDGQLEPLFVQALKGAAVRCSELSDMLGDAG